MDLDLEAPVLSLALNKAVGHTATGKDDTSSFALGSMDLASRPLSTRSSPLTPFAVNSRCLSLSPISQHGSTSEKAPGDSDHISPSGCTLEKRRLEARPKPSKRNGGDANSQSQPFLWLDPNRPSESEGRTVIDSWQFRCFIGVTIFANVIQLGAGVEFTGPAWDQTWQYCNHVFTAIFTGEMLIKLWVLRERYFYNRWNLVDFLLAVLGIVDTWIMPFVLSSQDAFQLQVLKLFRLLRLVRMVKLLRMHRELHVLLEGILYSMKSMLWVGMLLALIIYTWAIFCVVAMGPSLAEHTSEDFFGSVPRACLSLFSIVLLTEWSGIVWPVFETQPAMLIVLILFVMITSWGVLNVIIGLIVERTNEAAQKVRDEDREALRRMQLEAVCDLTRMMCELDANKDEWLSLNEMAAAAENPKFVDMLKQINLPLGFGLNDLYLMLDQDMNNQVTSREFVDGMYRLVYSNEFQHICLAHLSIAQVKQQVKQAQRDMLREVGKVRQEQEAFAKDMKDSMAQILQELRKDRKECAI